MLSLSVNGVPLWLLKGRARSCNDEKEEGTGQCPRQQKNIKNDSACLPGFPVPEVSWFRDGQVISTSTLPGVQITFSDGRAKLMIPTVTKANSGRYSLRATNGSGQATSTAELLVTGKLLGTSLSQARPKGIYLLYRKGVQIELHTQGEQLPS